ncbi:uncharacterized protein LOC115621264 [Scaptodrosophila lebanonensis]|uniref:Uncharacterized protein LOC115621264 n=1 Tax=Drosophila lebanonensis TaxID=7225 RepID=A0A6J2T6G8_DROLE|nr:uncharacterized protein LOC115621264 [Scaptodrosophila lebanonensis]
MLPANIGAAEHNHTKMEIQMSPSVSVKPSPSPVGSVTSVKTSKPMPVRYLPIAAMPTKPCHLTVNNNNINNNNSHTMAPKGNLQPINVVQTNHHISQTASSAAASSPFIQLTPNPNGSTTLAILPVPVNAKAGNPQPAVMILPAHAQNGVSVSSNTPINSTKMASPVGITGTTPQPQTAVSSTTTTTTTSTIPKVLPNITALVSIAGKSVSVPLKPSVTLSKSAVEQIRFRLGHMNATKCGQVQNSAGGSVILAKALNGNKKNLCNGNKPVSRPGTPTENSEKSKPKAQDQCQSKHQQHVMTKVQKPFVAVTPKPPPSIATASKLSPAPTKTTTGIKQVKTQVSDTITAASTSVPAPAPVLQAAQQDDLMATVQNVAIPSAVITRPVPSPPTPIQIVSEAAGGNRTQRSKSLAGNRTNVLEQGTPGRRHSVNVMAKIVAGRSEQQKTIETITIEDDTDEEDVSPEPQPVEAAQPITTTTATSQNEDVLNALKSSPAASEKDVDSDADSSDVEEVFVPSPKPVESADVNRPTGQQQQQSQQNVPTMPAINIVKAETLPVSTEDFEKSLKCDEQVIISSPSSASTSSSSISGNTSKTSAPTIQLAPFARLAQQPNENMLLSKAEAPTNEKRIPPSKRFHSLKRSMQMYFNMVQWCNNEPASMQNSKLRFDLNHFNLLQLSERCEPRQGPASYFEMALFDRPVRRPKKNTHPLLDLCIRCNGHGPATDFLAPRFCSINCVKRAQKRRAFKRRNPVVSQESAPGKMPRQSIDARSTSTGTKKPFRWSDYLMMKGNSNAAPIHLFLNPFPISPNCFEIGMKLEAIDPENCSLFCVCTIVEVRGYRLKLNFDGYSAMYDFWVNADSMDIFPPGWCERTNRVLQPPKGYNAGRFNWYRYLVKTNKKAAPRSLFTHLNASSPPCINGFEVGMHIEAEDLNDTGKICVATVADIIGERIRVHFDGWDDCYDFWAHVSSPYIHPCDWHQGRQQLIVPPDFHKSVFNWVDYIRDMGGVAAPSELFTPREPMEFHSQMKLEVVDQRNPCLIRPATVVTRKGYRVQLHLDCWPAEYYFWLEDDSPDLHPVGWCEATSHELEPPPGYLQRPPQMPCDVEGCRGFGNAKRFNLNVHALRDCCPYAPENWRQWRSKTVKPPRVSSFQIIRELPPSESEHPTPLSMTMSNTLKVESSKRKLSSGSKKSSEYTAPKSVRLSPMRIMEESPIKFERETKHAAKIEKPSVNENHEAPAEVVTSGIKLEPNVEQQTSVDTDPAKNVDLVSLDIAKTIVEDYGPQYIRNYRLWQTNGDFKIDEIKTNPLHWTNWDVYEYIERSLHSEDIAKVLLDEDVDGRALLLLRRDDLSRYLKLKVGPAVKLFSTIVNLRIAAVCKFETSKTGLDISLVRLEDYRNQQNSPFEHERIKTEIGHMDEENANNIVEDREEDVVLDNDDFLSVKPSTSIANHKKNFTDGLDNEEAETRAS